MTPRRVLLLGWAVFAVYAYPGYMSYDSVRQLVEARAGVFQGDHPPLMGLVWRAVDALVAGPFGMLVLQSVCFLAGTYLLLARVLRPRTAAIAASLVMWFPPVAAVLAVIWKDSQMVAFLVFGTALIVSDSRPTRLVGLACFFLATGLRYNALAPTFPLVTLLFVWTPGQRWFLRYPLAIATWFAITAAAGALNGALSERDPHMWHRSIALMDLTGTLRYASPIPDEQVRAALDGVPLVITQDIQAATQRPHPASDLDDFTLSSIGGGTYVPDLWVRARHVFALPETFVERAAISRAWRAVVLGDPVAYATYRWHVTRERLQLGTSEVPSASYVWFVDVTDIAGSSQRLGHNAVPGKLQAALRDGMLALSTSLLFRPWIYLALAVLALGLAGVARSRLAIALSLTGIANEVILFVVAPTIDYRYSIWLVVAALLSAVLSVGLQRRGSRRDPRSS